MAELGNDSGNITYITTFNGKLVQRVPEGTPGSVSRALTKGANEGKIVWEKHYTCVTGMITGGEVAVKEFDGKKIREIQIKLDDNIILQLPMNLLSMFAKPLPNVDASEPVKISIYKNRQDKIGLQISQGEGFEDSCDWAYTREDPNGLPPAEKDDLGDWDFRAHDAFLIAKVGEFFSSIDGGSAPEAPEAPAEDKPPVSDKDVPADFDEYEDDIPF